MKTLIAYATKTGTAEKAAEMIAEKLNEKPDVVNIGTSKTPDLSAYDFILVGGPIHMGRVNKAVKKFLAKNKKVLLSKRFGLYLACGYPEEIEKYFNAILGEGLKPRAEILSDIGYAYYLEKMGPIAQKVVFEFVKINETVEAYKPEAIQAIADTINK